MYRQAATVPAAIPKGSIKLSNGRRAEEKSQLQEIKPRGRNGSLPPMPVKVPTVDHCYDNDGEFRKTLEKMK